MNFQYIYRNNTIALFKNHSLYATIIILKNIFQGPLK